jgi:plasmid stabilization system protein ParE
VKLIRLAAAAEADLRAARRYYNSVSPSLGDGFLLHVENALDRIAAHPELYQFVFGNVRRTPLNRFPYNVFYRTLPTHIEIIAVLHAFRNPVSAQLRTISG